MHINRFVVINLAIAIALISLYGYDVSVQPIKIKIDECHSYTGKYVSVTGTVSHVNSNGRAFSIVDGDFTHELEVYNTYLTHVNPGAKVRAAGLVQKYHGHYELVTQRHSDIQILQKWYSTSIPVLLSNPESFKGMRVSVSGKIGYVRVQSLTIYDSTGSVQVSCDGYAGERDAYFLVKYTESGFVLRAAYPEQYGKLTAISELKNKVNKTYLVHGHVEEYGLYGYIRYENYSLRFTEENRVIPDGYVTVTGYFQYAATYGEYVLNAGNVK